MIKAGIKNNMLKGYDHMMEDFKNSKYHDQMSGVIGMANCWYDCAL